MAKQELLSVVVLPGDDVTRHVFPDGVSNERNSVKLGTGLSFRHDDRRVYATAAGRLDQRKSGGGNSVTHFVRQNLRRYRPAVDDRVVGIVEDRAGPDGAGGDLYRVNVAASHPALLSNLAFEGATKRNRPAFRPGQLLYARVASLNDGVLDVTLSCINGPRDAALPRKDWMTNEGAYGELRGGTCCRITTGLARELLKPDNLVLNELAAAKIAFEVAVGVNGLLWIHSALPDYTVLIQNAIKNSAVLTEEQVRGMVKSLVYTVRKQLQQDADAVPESYD
jgi:exosome complex component RRP40